MIQNSRSVSASGKVAERLPYQSPQLIQFGTVRDLTQGGTQGPGETPGNCANLTKSAPCPASPSERSLKQNIVQVGVHPAGYGLYLFDYVPAFQPEFGYRRQFGVMADEVQRVVPQAIVVDDRGFRKVDYSLLGIERTLQ